MTKKFIPFSYSLTNSNVGVQVGDKIEVIDTSDNSRLLTVIHVSPTHTYALEEGSWTPLVFDDSGKAMSTSTDRNAYRYLDRSYAVGILRVWRGKDLIIGDKPSWVVEQQNDYTFEVHSNGLIAGDTLRHTNWFTSRTRAQEVCDTLNEQCPLEFDTNE